MDLIDENLQEQINNLKEEIRHCDDDRFDELIYKYNVFKDIRNTYLEELIEPGKYDNILENDKNILEKIYQEFLGMNMYSLPETFDQDILQEFLNKIENSYIDRVLPDLENIDENELV